MAGDSTQFGKVPTAITSGGSLRGLMGSDAKVMLSITGHMNGRTMSCYPSIATIAAETGYSQRTVYRALSRLEAAGLLLIDHRGPAGGRNYYSFAVPTPDMAVRGSDVQPLTPPVIPPLTSGARTPDTARPKPLTPPVRVTEYEQKNVTEARAAAVAAEQESRKNFAAAADHQRDQACERQQRAAADAALIQRERPRLDAALAERKRLAAVADGIPAEDLPALIDHVVTASPVSDRITWRPGLQAGSPWRLIPGLPAAVGRAWEARQQTAEAVA